MWNQALDVNERVFELYDRMVGEGVDLVSVLEQVADVARDVTNAERATVYVINEETQMLESVGLVGDIMDKIRIPVDKKSLAGYCASTGTAYVVHDVHGDLTRIDPELRFNDAWDGQNDFYTYDVMCAPAHFKDQIVGVVQAINSKDGQFEAASLAPLKTLSRLIGYALYHARIYEDLSSLKQLDREKADFMRLLVHELKAPIAAARSSVSLMEEGYATKPEQIVKFSGRVGARLDQLTNLIKDILEMAKVKSRNSMSEVTEFDSIPKIREHLQVHLESAEAKGIQMQIDLPDEAFKIRFDVQGFQLVVSNLASNAVKYTLQGTVHIRLFKQDDGVVFEVRDSGIGIPAKDLPNMFKEFHRASNARQHDIPGSGVGLSGTKQMIERFGGTIAIESQENEGTTFRVTLPLCSVT